MTGKLYGWHKQWQIEGDCLVHASGLRVERNAKGECSLVETSVSSFFNYEKSRGVPEHDLKVRLQRLLKEAS